MLYKTCTKCFLQKPIEDFPWKYESLGIRHAVCKECTAKRSNDWYKENKAAHIQNVMANKKADRERARQYVWNYLSTHPCTQCGESNPVVLEFDHLRGKDKNISNLINDGATPERIRKEIDKCQVLCANCHRKKTAQERGWFRNGS